MGGQPPSVLSSIVQWDYDAWSECYLLFLQRQRSASRLTDGWCFQCWQRSSSVCPEIWPCGGELLWKKRNSGLAIVRESIETRIEKKQERTKGESLKTRLWCRRWLRCKTLQRIFGFRIARNSMQIFYKIVISFLALLRVFGRAFASKKHGMQYNFWSRWYLDTTENYCGEESGDTRTSNNKHLI